MAKWNVMALIEVEARDAWEATDKATEVAERCSGLRMDVDTPIVIEVLDDVGGFYCPELVDSARPIPGATTDLED